MALPIYFFIKGYEIAARQAGSLQYLNGDVWVDLGNWVCNEGEQIIIDSHRNQIPIDYGIFSPNTTWFFRLVDSEGHPVSRTVEYIFPLDQGEFNNDFNNDFYIFV